MGPCEMLKEFSQAMSAILLTGGTGFIGNHLRHALTTERVILLGRREPDLLPNERWLHVNLEQLVSPQKLKGERLLCHLAYSMANGRDNLQYNRHLLDAVNARPSIEHVVLMSSTSVYGTTASPVVDEESPCKPVGEYPQTKLAVELLWREGLRDDCILTVLRPSTVIGPSSIGLASMIRDALHSPIIGPIKRSVLYHRSVHYVAVRNVVAAVLFSLRHPHASVREIYVVSDDHHPENESYAAMQDAVRKSTGQSPFPSLAMPQCILPTLGNLTGRSTLGLKRCFSSQKLHDMGFKDATTLYDEVRRAVQAFERQSV